MTVFTSSRHIPPPSIMYLLLQPRSRYCLYLLTTHSTSINQVFVITAPVTLLSLPPHDTFRLHQSCICYYSPGHVTVFTSSRHIPPPSIMYLLSQPLSRDSLYLLTTHSASINHVFVITAPVTLLSLPPHDTFRLHQSCIWYHSPGHVTVFTSSRHIPSPSIMYLGSQPLSRDCLYLLTTHSVSINHVFGITAPVT